MDHAIEAADLVKTYPGDVRALDGLSFEVETGHRLRDARSERRGQVHHREDPDHPVAAGRGAGAPWPASTSLAEPDRRPARHRGRRPALGRGPRGDRPREPRACRDGCSGWAAAPSSRASSELLERFGLSEAADRIAKTYSGGMQRRLDIALGLIHHPQVLFLDEPTTGLDPEVRADMWERSRGSRADERLTILLTTHYLEEADRLAGRLGDRRPRPDRRRGHARRAEGRPRG